MSSATSFTDDRQRPILRSSLKVIITTESFGMSDGLMVNSYPFTGGLIVDKPNKKCCKMQKLPAELYYTFRSSSILHQKPNIGYLFSDI
jgi:hypothetical protein